MVISEIHKYWVPRYLPAADTLDEDTSAHRSCHGERPRHPRRGQRRWNFHQPRSVAPRPAQAYSGEGCLHVGLTLISVYYSVDAWTTAGIPHPHPPPGWVPRRQASAHRPCSATHPQWSQPQRSLTVKQNVLLVLQTSSRRRRSHVERTLERPGCTAAWERLLRCHLEH